MFSAISDESSDPEEPTSLMLTAATRTLSVLKRIQRRVQNTRSRMEKLLLEDSMSANSPLVSYQSLKTRGLLFSVRKINENFLSLLRSSCLGISSPDSNRSRPLRSGGGLSWENHMQVPPGSPLQMELFLTWLNTEEGYWTSEVSVLTVPDRRPVTHAGIHPWLGVFGQERCLQHGSPAWGAERPQANVARVRGVWQC